MRIAVIGLGRMGLRHLQIMSESGHQIVGIADARNEALTQAQATLGCSPDVCFESADAMLDRVGAECVIIATTAPAHCQLTVAAAERGASHILCEKPMAVSLRQCDEMLEACARAGTKLAINHQMRFMEQYTRSKAIVHSEAFGRLGSVTVVAGNFGLAMNGIHYFEMFRFITDEPAIAVSARFSSETVPNPRGPQFVDRAGTIRLETPSGARFYMDASADQGHGMQVVYAGRNGRLTVDELAGRATLVARRPEHRAQPTTRYGMAWEEEALTIAPADAVEPARAVLNALLGGGDFPTGADGRRAIEILVAAYLSDEENGRTVHLDREELPRDRLFPWA
jgi:predicted dehydrogenase